LKKKIGLAVRNFVENFDKSRALVNSRKYADKLRLEIAENHGAEFVDQHLLNKIKKYADEVFGDAGYGHWLALYAEIRKEFIEGWIGEDYYRSILLPKWNEPKIANLSTLKTFDHRLFPGMTIEPIGMRISGIYYTAEHDRISEMDFVDLIRSHRGEIVIKQDRSGSGKGIHFIESDKFNLNELDKVMDLLVQPSVRQHPSFSRLHPGSVNTLRITTFQTGAGDIVVKHRSMRVGVSGERIVNTYGGFFFLDSSGRGYTHAYNDDGRDLGGRHPDTGFKYREFCLESISEAEELCIKAHWMYPYIRFVGWDLYINEENRPVIIEWNTRPDIWVNEAVIGPLWKDGRH